MLFPPSPSPLPPSLSSTNFPLSSYNLFSPSWLLGGKGREGGREGGKGGEGGKEDRMDLLRRQRERKRKRMILGGRKEGGGRREGVIEVRVMEKGEAGDQGGQGGSGGRVSLSVVGT